MNSLYIIVVLSLSVAVYGGKYGGLEFCTVTDKYGHEYDFTSLTIPENSTAFLYTDLDGTKWYINICGTLDGLLDETGKVLKCEEDANICFTTDSIEYIKAAEDINKSKYKYDPDLISIGFKDGDTCSKKEKFDVTMLFYCDESVQNTIKVTEVDLEDKCEPVIRVNSSVACPRYVYSTTQPYVNPPIAVGHNGSLASSFSVIIGGGIICCLMLTALTIWNRRRRRIQSYNKQRYEGIELQSVDSPVEQLPVMGQDSSMPAYVPPQMGEYGYAQYGFPIVQPPQYMQTPPATTRNVAEL